MGRPDRVRLAALVVPTHPDLPLAQMVPAYHLLLVPLLDPLGPANQPFPEVPLDRQAANLAFSGPGKQTLYLTIVAGLAAPNDENLCGTPWG